MCLRKMALICLIWSLPNSLPADNTSSIDEALSRPVVDGRLNMTIGVLGDADGLTYGKAYGFTRLDRRIPAEVDSIVAIASMTKLITTIAALQLYDEGKLDIDAPIDTYLADLKELKILSGFDAERNPIYVWPDRRPTARELMSHTSGFVYSLWNRNAKIAEKEGITGGLRSGREMITNAPLAFEPGQAWEYGISTDWLGVIVEEVSNMKLAEYFDKRIFDVLLMEDSFYEIPKEKISRVANLLFRGETNFLLKALSIFTSSDLVEVPFISAPEVSKKYSSDYYSGGGGLYSTLPDYAKLLQCLLNGGELEGNRILSEKTVEMMFTSQTANLPVGSAASQDPVLTNDIDMGFGSEAKFGLGLLLHPAGTKHGRNPHSGSWGGLFNTYYWLDREAELFGIFATQVSPFFDLSAVETLHAFESAAYAGVAE